MTMSVQLMTFTTCFGNNKAENPNLIPAFSFTGGNFAIVVMKRVLSKHSLVIFSLVYHRQSLKS